MYSIDSSTKSETFQAFICIHLDESQKMEIFPKTGKKIILLGRKCRPSEKHVVLYPRRSLWASDQVNVRSLGARNDLKNDISISIQLVSRQKEAWSPLLGVLAWNLDLIKHSGPTAGDDRAPQTTTDCENFTLDFMQCGFSASPFCLHTLWTLISK